MKTFFSTLFHWLDGLRRILINLFFLLVLSLIIVAMMAERPTVPEQAALIVNPTGMIVEELEMPSSDSLLSRIEMASAHQTQMHDLIQAIRSAARDNRIRLMVLKLDEMDAAALPKLQEIRSAIEHFRTTGKQVVAIGPNYTQSQYYLAATADQVFLDPMGVVALEGFSVYRNYIQEALAKLHINVRLFRAGEYKSAAEPLVRNNMSEADRAANRALLTTLWTAYKRGLGEMRGIDGERLQQVLDKPSSFLAAHHGNISELARAEKLVDALASQSEIQGYIAGLLGHGDNYPAIEFRNYLRIVNGGQAVEHENQVAVIATSGMILDGEQPPGTVGSLTMAEKIKRARTDDKIKAVVLRIDSPGGSAAASEAVRSEILRLKQSGKPVVASMGSMAASGGYWIAAAADEIWAAPTTITGSIGVFGVLADFEQGLRKLGVHTDGLGTTTVAGGVRADRQLPPELAKVMQLAIEHVYDRFLNVVSEGRKMETEEVRKVAEGRVWTGVDAKRLGLVDHLGGFDAAIDAAAKRAGLGKDYGRVWILPPQSLENFILEQIFGSADTYLAGLGRDIGVRLLSQMGLADSRPLMENMGQLSRIIGLSARQPGVFAACDLRVE